LNLNVVLIYDEIEMRYKAPDGDTTLTLLSPDWFFWWVPGMAELGHFS